MKKSRRRLKLILDYGTTAQDFLQGKTLSDWQKDLQLQYAVAHALAGVVENVKEYVQDAARLQHLQQTYPHIQWKLIIRFRDKMIHHYEVLDQDILFEFATLQLPELLEAIKEMIGNAPLESGQGFVLK